MAETYCGKNCAACEERQQLNCPGCRMGPGKVYQGGDCAIAKCCISRHHSACAECTTASTCFNLRSSNHAAATRLKKQKDTIAGQQRLLGRCKLLGNWLLVLFWLLIISTVSGTVLQSVPELELPAAIASLTLNVCYALVLLRLSAESYSYRIAGISALVCAGLSLFASLLGDSGWAVAVTFVAVIPAFIKDFQEFMGHAEAIKEFDSDMAEKWVVLWYWNLGCLCATVVGTVLTLIGLVLAAFVVIAAALGTVVVAVIKLIYLYRTAKACREYVEECSEIV